MDESTITCPYSLKTDAGMITKKLNKQNPPLHLGVGDKPLPN